MKRALIILVMVLMAATTYNQTSRRTTNGNATAERTRTETRSNPTTSRNSSSNSNVTQNSQSRQSTANNQATRPNNSSYSNTRPETNNQKPERTSTSNTNVQNNPPRTNPAGTTVRTNENSSGGTSRTNQNPSTNSPRTQDNSNVNNTPRTNSNPSTGTTRTYEGSSNNNSRTYSNPSGGNPRTNTNEHHPSGGDGREVSAHHNNVNANVHASYPSSRVYHGSHTPSYSYHNNYHPMPRDYREVHYVYRAPVHYDIIWTREMHRHYCEMYPSITWHYSTGYRIPSVSAYRADYYIGEVMNVYGQVSDVYYSPESDEYFLYVGPYYPYQDFTIVVPGWVARNYSYRPVSYFLNQHVSITGLITSYEGIPEIVVKRNFQINVY